MGAFQVVKSADIQVESANLLHDEKKDGLIIFDEKKTPRVYRTRIVSFIR